MISRGKPIIRGLRISVELILSLLAQGETEDAILADYPDLAREDIRACLAARTPSLRRIRWTRFRCSEILERLLRDHSRELAEGAVLTVRGERIRISRLP